MPLALQVASLTDTQRAQTRERAAVLLLETRGLVAQALKNPEFNRTVKRMDTIIMDTTMDACVAAVGYTYKRALGKIVHSKKTSRNLLWM